VADHAAGKCPAATPTAPATGPIIGDSSLYLCVLFSLFFSIFRVLPRRIQINDDREQATVAESDQLLARDRLHC
jgi:hypothetical protein